ncbi:MAG: trypsin-like peptidase domain-containing protein [candidate division WOR-3 bacterium]|nr:trypsin-like peptidase domain-containing protein [candidate division WOR-3 bacterium]
MKKREIIAALAGFFICLIILSLYNQFKPRKDYTALNYLKLVNLNDEISKQRMNAIVLAANKVGPAVVSITVIQTRIITVSPFNDEFFRRFFGDFFPEHRYRQQVQSLGSGVIISPDGYILTNEHVVSNATEINVTLPDARQFKAKIVAMDRALDLALLKIDGHNLPYAELGDSDDLMIGEWVVALGNPFGFLLEDTRPTVTVGVVSALNRAIKSTHEDRVYKDMIQTDAAINPGNSGGPLVNILGQVIGINTFILTSSGGSEGVGFARPINVVKKFINETKQYGKIRTPWIGIWVQELTPEIAEAMGIEQRGVLVSSVDLNSPAYISGIKEGDRIIMVNNEAINTTSAWDRINANTFVGDTLKIRLYRDKDSLDISLVVTEFQEPLGYGSKLGIYVEDINPYLIKKFDLGYKQGVVVTRVEPGSIGEKLGISPGDVILRIGATRIRNKEDFKKAINDFKNKYFIIDRGGLIFQIWL